MPEHQSVPFLLDKNLPMKKNEITFKAHFNPNRTAIKVDGEGESTITFTSDATQLAKVLSVLALEKNSLLELRVKRLSGGYENGAERGRARTRVQTIH